MAAFASCRRSGWVRVLVVILCALFIFATVVATRFDDNTAQQPSQPTDAHQFFGTQPANSNQQAGNGMRNSTFGSNADKGMPNQDFFTVNNIDIPVWMRK